MLGAWSYQANQTVLHTDRTVMPPKARAWASWNYQREAEQDQVEYLPRGGFLAALIDRLFVRRNIKQTFQYRKQQIQALFGSSRFHSDADLHGG